MSIYRKHKMCIRDSVWVIYNDSFGTIWIGTRNGLAKYNQRTDNFTGYISEDTSFGRPACNEIISLMESSQGVLWVGTWYGGLARFNKETGQFLSLIHICPHHICQ